MKNLKRVFGVVMAVSLFASSFVGCGTEKKTADTTTTQTATTQEVKKDPIKLQFWGGVPAESGPQEVVDNYNKLDKNVQIEYVRFVNGDEGNTKVDISLMSGSDIDLFVSYGDATLAKRVANGTSLDLTDLIKKVGIDMPAYFGPDIEAYKVNGKFYSIPTAASTKCILYNQKMFDDAKIPYPKPGWTYDEFADAAKKLTKGTGANKVYGYYYPAFDAGQPVTELVMDKAGANWMYSADGKSTTFDSTDIKKSFDLFMGRVKEGIEPNYVDNKTQKMAGQDMLLKGQAAMIFGAWHVRYVKDTKTYPHDFKVGFATIPKLGGASQTKNYTSSLSDYVSINSKSKNPDAAMKFIKWYVEGGMDPMIPGGRLPSYAKADKAKVAALAFKGSESLFDMDSAQKVFLTPGDLTVRTNNTAAAEINTILTEEFEKAFAGAQTPDAAIKNAKTRADAKLK